MKNELIERYLYEVTRRLPEGQRSDIEKELRSLIEDMIEERGNGDEERIVRDVLEELGDPAKLAAKYRGDQGHLIGGEYYPVYCQVLKIVLLCVAVGIGIASCVQIFLAIGGIATGEGPHTIKDGFDVFFNIPEVMFNVFAGITIIFFLMERYHAKLESKETKWNISKLPSIPTKKAMISRSESIISLVVSSALIVVFICVPQFLCAWVKNDAGEVVKVSIVNASVWSKIIPFLVAVVIIGMIDDSIKLITGKYCSLVMAVNIACCVVNMGLTLIIFKGFNIWNRDMVAELSEVTGKTYNAKGDLISYWVEMVDNGRLSDAVICIFAVAYTIEIGVTIYKTYRYSK